MLLNVNSENEIVVNEKILFIKSFRKLHDKYADTDYDLMIAYFSVIYYMYHFDSKQFWDHREDESARLAAVRKFVHKGLDVKIDRTMQAAMKEYKRLYKFESVSTYFTMKESILKIQEFMDMVVLFRPPLKAGEEPDESLIVIEAKDLAALNKLLPAQWKDLDKFEKDLLQNVQSTVDILGQKALNAYET